MPAGLQEKEEEDLGAFLAELTRQLSCIVSAHQGVECSRENKYICLLWDPPLYCFSISLRKALIQYGTSIDTRDVDKVLLILKRYGDTLPYFLETDSLRCLAYLLLGSTIEYGIERGLFLLMDEPRYIIDSGSMKSKLMSLTSKGESSVIKQNLICKFCLIFTDEKSGNRVRRLAGKMLVEMIYDSKDHCLLLADGYWPNLYRIGRIFLYNEDIITLVCASVIIRTLLYSGIDDGTLWNADDSHHRRLFFESLDNKQENALHQFYTYAHHMENEQYRLNAETYTIPSCHLLKTDEINEASPIKGSVIFKSDVESLKFINLFGDTMGWHFQYLEFQSGLPPRASCTVSKKAHEPDFYLTLDIWSDDEVLVNGKVQKLDNLGFSTNFINNIIEIQSDFEKLGIDFRRRHSEVMPIVRKSSSLVIRLDAGEDTPTNILSDFTTREPINQCLADHSERSSPGAPGSSPGEGGKSRSPLSEVGYEADIEGAATEKLPRYPKRATTYDRLRSANPQTRVRGMPLSPDTQESLLFPRRHSRGKRYSATSKAAVDLDEDLRTSDGLDVAKDEEITSISSPLPYRTRFLFEKKTTNELGEDKRRRPTQRTRNTAKEWETEKKGQKPIQQPSNPKEENVNLNKLGESTNKTTEVQDKSDRITKDGGKHGTNRSSKCVRSGPREQSCQGRAQRVGDKLAVAFRFGAMSPQGGHHCDDLEGNNQGDNMGDNEPRNDLEFLKLYHELPRNSPCTRKEQFGEGMPQDILEVVGPSTGPLHTTISKHYSEVSDGGNSNRTTESGQNLTLGLGYNKRSTTRITDGKISGKRLKSASMIMNSQAELQSRRSELSL